MMFFGLLKDKLNRLSQYLGILNMMMLLYNTIVLSEMTMKGAVIFCFVLLIMFIILLTIDHKYVRKIEMKYASQQNPFWVGFEKNQKIIIKLLENKKG